MQLTPRQLEALRTIAAGRIRPTLVKEEDGYHARWCAAGSRGDGAADVWIDEFVREATVTRLSEDAEDVKHYSLHDAWILALRSRTGLVRWDESECEEFSKELEEWGGDAAEDVEARRSLVFEFKPFEISCRYPRSKRALKALGQACQVYPPLSAMRGGKLELSPSAAEDFISKGSRDLVDAGYAVNGVDIKAPVSLVAEMADEKGSALNFEFRIAGEKVSADEIRFLLDQGGSLVFFREHWIEIDRAVLKEALRTLERGASKPANLMSFAFGVGRVGSLEIEELKAKGWLRGLVNRLSAKGEGVENPWKGPGGPAGFAGNLRAYQVTGVTWMKFLTDHGFGALLADEMGLGKTIQTIAWILCDRAGRDDLKPVLVVAPLTLLSNWRREISSFAPSLRVYQHHGESRMLASGFADAAAKADVVLTSYNLMVRDFTAISEVEWDALVLDEAQMVKNPDTAVARAVRALMPRKRVAITGTPVENSLMDIWSLEDFLNPGFLGERSVFRERFARPVAMNPDSAMRGRLRRALEPFVMRRLKSEKGVASELGEKREIREYSQLDPLTRARYEEALLAYRSSERSPGDQLALLTRLKLICDGCGDDSAVGGSLQGGKFERLCQLIESILENGESALVFTQYVKVGRILRRELEKRFSRRFEFLHGSLSPRERDLAVRRFTSSSRSDVFILSLKTGGYGLNLTKATHVIHYDRWWNPAAENQATDRAHRIGQQKTVFVHLMITEGTLEDRIDDILRRKESLKDVISNGGVFWSTVALSGGGDV